MAARCIATAPEAGYTSVGSQDVGVVQCGLFFHRRRIEAAEEHPMILISIPTMSVIVAPTRI